MPLMKQGAGQEGLPSVCSGMGELADKYDAFLLDQWGVMHDGTRAHEGAIECMEKLAELGKKVVLLSNSSKRVGTSLKKLDKMGFDSGTVSNPPPFPTSQPRKCSPPARFRRGVKSWIMCCPMLTL